MEDASVFLISRKTCFLCSQLKLFVELVVGVIEVGVFGFNPLWASNGESVSLVFFWRHSVASV